MTSDASFTCDCGNTARWRHDVDAASGTVYAECAACGRRHLVTPERSWVNWGQGVWYSGDFVVGSAWTQKVSPEFWGQRTRSRLTDG